MTKLTGKQIADAGLDGWVFLLGGLQTRIRTPDFATGVSLLNAIAEAAERQNHHPDLDLRYTHLDARLTSHDTHGVTERDVRLARTISTLAADAGLRTESSTISRLELALDAPGFETIRPFWRAVLAYADSPVPGLDDELNDPHGALPTMWFQPSGSDEPRQRWHPDVWVEPAQVRPRIEAALAAGGTLVSDDHAPSFWVLADPDGNRVCLCTWQERDRPEQ